VPGTLPKISWEETRVVKIAASGVGLAKDSKATEEKIPEKTRGDKTTVKPAPGKSGSKSGSKSAGESGKVELDLDVIERARSSGKPIMFYVHGNCTGPADEACKTMVNLVLRQKPIVTLATNFHAVEIDASKLDASLGERYKLKVSPSVVFVDYQGKVLTVLRGKQSPKQLTASMQSVLAENARRLEKGSKAAAEPGKPEKPDKPETPDKSGEGQAKSRPPPGASSGGASSGGGPSGAAQGK